MSGQVEHMWEAWQSVAELNERIRDLLESELPFVRVRGEITDLRAPASGHLYFSLIDGESRIRAVVWRATRRRLNHPPGNGDAVLVTGRVAVYAPRGEYQLVVEGLRADGAGTERERFLKLYRRLAEEGLFEESRKRPLPFLPRVIGVVTSGSGAALHDIIRVLDHRFPDYLLLLAPARVQGAEAPGEIAAALNRLVADGRAQVIICGRGGGSAEDLATFNSETVCRAIAACPIPVVSAVGHEVDLTLADLAADLRAPTPSAAAERIMPEKRTLAASVATLRERNIQAVAGHLRRHRLRWQVLQKGVVHPRRTIDAARFRCDELSQRLVAAASRLTGRQQAALVGIDQRLALWRHNRALTRCRTRTDHGREALARAMGHDLARHRQRLESLTTRLRAVSPLAVLERGYALVRDGTGGVVRNTDRLHPGDSIHVTLAAGALDAQIIQVRRDA